MRPPRLTEWLLAAVLPSDVAGRSVLGDLHEEYVERAPLGRGRARRWYRREALSIVVRALVPGREGLRRTGNERRGDPVWNDLVKDTQLALRGLARTPRFTAITALTLALGIGTATAIFSVVNGVLLEPLELPEPDALVNVASTAPGLGYDRFPLSPDIYFWYGEQSRSFASIGLYQQGLATLTQDGEPERVRVAQVSHTLLPTLGVQPELGRVFRPEEDVPDAPRVVMLSHSLWQRRYGEDRAILDRTIVVNGEQAVVVGVLPAEFDFLQDNFSGDEDGSARGVELFSPARLNAETPIQGSFGWNAIARLNPGVTPEAAQAELVPLIPRMLEETGVSDNYGAFIANGQYAPVVASLKDDLVGGIDGPLWILMGTVLVVLLIACANVANLFLIRAEGRQRDTAVQAALGASRGLLIRKQLVESFLLAAIGGAGGLLLAAGGTPALVRAAPPQIPRLANVGLDMNVALFALAATLLAALFFGVAPAIRYTRPGMTATLRHGGRGSTVGRTRHRLRGLLVVTQTAMALILLVGSGLLVRSLQEALATDPGFDTENILTFRLSLPATKYPSLTEQVLFFQTLQDRLEGLPGVTSVGAVSQVPLMGGAPGTAHSIEGQTLEPGQLPPLLHYKLATDGYMETMGLRLVSGRTFTRADRGTDNMVIAKDVADRLWPGEEPLGRRIRVTGDTIGWFTVIGVVQPVLQLGYRQDPQPLLYYPLDAQRAPLAANAMTFTLRTAAGASLTPTIRTLVRELDPDLPVAEVRTMEQIAAESVVTLSFTVLTLGIAAGFALLLGAIGLYGVLAYAVTMRTREIGVRMALGAERGTVMKMVIGQGTKLAAIGLVIGIAGAIAATRLLQGILFGVAPLDPLTFAVTSLVFLSVAFIASWLPARRAAAVDPMTSLQNE